MNVVNTVKYNIRGILVKTVTQLEVGETLLVMYEVVGKPTTFRSRISNIALDHCMRFTVNRRDPLQGGGYFVTRTA